MQNLSSIHHLIKFTSDVFNETQSVEGFEILQKNIQYWKKHNDITTCDPEMVELLGKLENNIEKMHSNALIISANELNAGFLSEIKVIGTLKDPESAAIMTTEVCERYKHNRKLWAEEFGKENLSIDSFKQIAKIFTQLGIKLED